MKMRTIIAVAVGVALVAGASLARDRANKGKSHDDPSLVLVLDGSPVHNVGELRLHMSNWGMFGSWPGSGQPFSPAPSGEWPSGSGVEHIFTGGLWIGAIRAGVPAVSTASFALEFRPTQDPVDIVYRSSEGAAGGTRFPWPNADDDNDGSIDEDPLDGHDNDSDGSIDEDYAAISDQMFSRWYLDNTPEAVQIYPQHNPLDIEVRENTYQWDEDEFDDFVGFDFEITNIGNAVLEDVYIGVFIDADVGNRNTPNYWEDDIAGYRDLPLVCSPYGPVSIDFGYVCDNDGDGAPPGSCIGAVVLDHPTDATGQVAPPEVRWTTFANFSGSAAFEDGGDPTNDFERYELMSSQTIERDALIPRDYRILISTGPFDQLLPGQTVKFSMAVVAFPGPLLPANVARAATVYNGQWYDADGDPTTGVDGRETPVQGPAQGVVIDACKPPFDLPIDIGNEVVWINADCEYEAFAKLGCGYDEADAELFRTGVNGKEYQAHWVLPGAEPPVPVFVTAFEARVRAGVVELSWQVFADEEVAGFSVLRAEAGGNLAPLHDGMLARGTSYYVDTTAEAGKEYEYVLAAYGETGFEAYSQRIPVTTAAATLALDQNHPNPFNPSTTIAFTLVERGPVELSIHSADGRHVVTLMRSTADAGRTEVHWNGRDASGTAVSSGIYFYRLTAGNRTIAKKMVLLK